MKKQILQGQREQLDTIDTPDFISTHLLTPSLRECLYLKLNNGVFMCNGEHFKCQSPDIVMPASVWCICWVLAADRYWPFLLDTAPRSGGSLLVVPVGGKPEQGGLPIIVGKKIKEVSPAPRILVPKVFTDVIFLCLSTTDQSHRNGHR